MLPNSQDNSTNIEPVKPKRGRPSKAALEATKRVVGRPKETSGRIAEFKARLMATAGESVIDKIVSIAMNDNHPGQMAALKMCIDRTLPVSMFEKSNGVRPAVQVNIINATHEEQSNVAIDIQATEIDNDDA